jgi:cyclopropane-fatty-acyl-phospholipid synthase
MAAVVGITISEEQRRYAAEFCRGLPMEIRLQDYRELSEQFDCVATVGMLEHVDAKNYRRYMKPFSVARVKAEYFSVN